MTMHQEPARRKDGDLVLEDPDVEVLAGRVAGRRFAEPVEAERVRVRAGRG